MTRQSSEQLQTEWRAMRSPLRAALEDGDHEGVIAAARSHVEVDPTTGCWLWRGRRHQARRGGEYPVARVGAPGGTRREVQVHRIVLEAKLQSPLGRQQAHHVCGTSLCVNPIHLVPATHVENIAEMKARAAYVSRIGDLEAAIRELAPNHPLLTHAPIGPMLPGVSAEPMDSGVGCGVPSLL